MKALDEKSKAPEQAAEAKALVEAQFNRMRQEEEEKKRQAEEVLANQRVP